MKTLQKSFQSYLEQEVRDGSPEFVNRHLWITLRPEGEGSYLYLYINRCANLSTLSGDDFIKHRVGAAYSKFLKSCRKTGTWSVGYFYDQRFDNIPQHTLKYLLSTNTFTDLALQEMGRYRIQAEISKRRVN